MGLPREIYCPSCQRYLGRYDGRGTINPIINCRKCRKQVIFDIATRDLIVKDIPRRESSSGMTFR